jgi:Flp pilus assembly pilin Flp
VLDKKTISLAGRAHCPVGDMASVIRMVMSVHKYERKQEKRAVRSSLLQERSTHTMTDVFQRFIRDEEGQDMIEYALLASFISIVAIVAIKAIGPLVLAIYNAVVAALTP